MKRSLIFGFALVLSGVLFGCSTTRPAARTTILDYPATNYDMPIVLTGLGKRLSVRVEADSWLALIQKVKPTFAWNGCDLMWIEKDTNDQPKFVLDEAYIYEPSNQPPRWVLLDTHDAPFDKWYGEVMGNNLHVVATLSKAVPIADNDAGAIGDYAVVKSSHPSYGTVYEIGWQKLMANGNGCCEELRLLYVLKNRANQWQFVGEGIGDSSSKSGMSSARTSVQSHVIWAESKPAKIPLKIRFVSQCVESETSNEPDFLPRPDWVTYDESILAGPFPARLLRANRRSYLLTTKDDTFDKIVDHCAEWTFDWSRWPDRDAKKINEQSVEIWRKGLTQLNPQLPKTGSIKEGTRIEILNYEEVIDLKRH